ncbi:RNA pseudouridine synthase 4, mitochondrial isoform X2 [Elaeis guineensis]|uniref:RNA pseudouridine synthase 4, mitochondrial isoform X2 n=1 Tax=Elaeis guineensis var. tenera TaxID=51953 RepID=A0A6I9SG55_ELAGV|nr:RNA pseudouridine synthase 4, mitochondrial isoform X2 [Elaeis guineensis]
MAGLVGLGRRHLSSRTRVLATTLELIVAVFQRCSYTTTIAASSSYSSAREEEAGWRKEKGRWLTLPPFAPPVDASYVRKAIASGQRPAGEEEPTTALKWVRRCCPHLPMSLVQKLFRLRQVRRDLTKNGSHMDGYYGQQQLRRVSAKDVMMPGDVILLPVTVQNVATKKYDYSESEEEISFIRSLELYKDSAIIAVNKPPGMPVQGGVGIKYSMDALAAKSFKYDYPESPRLVHRLDRDSSGVLVLGRTQTSALVLHSIFREKTSGALSDTTCRALQRKYLALVIGTPKRWKGLISAPLTKIVLEDGKSERITIVKDTKTASSHHALTEYQVIRSSAHGFTWLELCPLTGRKHQLRVHLAEALGTPIVGDYKYGWYAHRKWEPMPWPESMSEDEKLPKNKPPFGLELDGGSIAEKQPFLHLHCKQMILPNISAALWQLQSSSVDHDFLELEKLNLVAPLPLHMRVSWDILSCLPR